MRDGHGLRSTRIGLTIGAACLALTGCTPWGPEGTLGYIGNNRVSVASANQLLGPHDTDKIESFSDERLINMIKPSGSSASTLDEAIKDFDDPKKWGASDSGMINKDVLNAMRRRRNELQATVILASNNRCNLYKTYLKHLDSSVNFGFGALTTLFGGLGSIINGEQAARTFSGLSGITSGVRSEFDQDFLARIATSVIIPGIERARADVMKQINERHCLSTDAYPVTFAIADAIRYHGACSLDIGIASSGQAAARESDPGLARVNEILGQIKTNRQLVQDLAGITTKRSADLQKQADAKKQEANKAQAAAQKSTQDAKDAQAAGDDNAAKAASNQAKQDQNAANTLKSDANKLQQQANDAAAQEKTDDKTANASKPLLGEDIVLSECSALPGEAELAPAAQVGTPADKSKKP